MNNINDILINLYIATAVVMIVLVLIVIFSKKEK